MNSLIQDPPEHWQLSAPVDESLECLLEAAIDKAASDIHLQPQAKQYRIRLRIDGMLHEYAVISLPQALRLISRLKVLSHLDLADTHLPQDGQLQYQCQHNQRIAAFRINICPALHGEQIALRQLTTEQRPLSLNQLGLTPQQYAQLTASLNQPQGLMLVTGPTGCGKTTTLYATLTHLDQQSRNLLTIEDPVESQLPNISQFNVHEKTGLTTLTLLRALLRQDPDVLMLGEIRDQAMLSTVIQASHTGHLVLSSLHSQNCLDTITRLSHLGVQPYHLAHTLNLIIAQRLLRQLCPHCKQVDTPAHHQLYATLTGKQATLYKAVGCERCTGGYRGRRGIFEMLRLNDAIREAILTQAPISEVEALAKQSGWQCLEQTAFAQAAGGNTSLAEVHRQCEISQVIGKLDYPMVQ